MGEISLHGVSSSLSVLHSNGGEQSLAFKTPQMVGQDLHANPYTPLGTWYVNGGSPDTSKTKRPLSSILQRPGKRKPKPILKSPESSVHGVAMPTGSDGLPDWRDVPQSESNTNTSTLDHSRHKASMALRPRKNVRFTIQQPCEHVRLLPSMRKENDRLVQAWYLIMVVPLVYEGWAFLFRWALCSASNNLLLVPDICCDAMFVLDVCVHAFVIPGSRKRAIENPLRLFNMYLRQVNAKS